MFRTLVPLPVLALLSLAPLAAPQAAPAESERVRAARAHYERVLDELESAGVTHPGRAVAIAWLRDYVERGELGVAPEGPWVRRPVFVDDAGRRCAVAWLLHRAGEDELVDAVAARDNGAWVAQLAGHDAFEAFLARHGLTLAEAARIQLPGSQPPTKDWNSKPSGAPPAGGGQPPNPSGSDTSSGGPSPDSSRPVSGGGAPPSGPATPLGGSSPSAPSSGGAPSATDWVRWFEATRADYFQPNRFRPFAGPSSGSEGGYPGQVVELLRERASVLFRADLDHPTAPVRSAAAIALGRVAGGEAVPALARSLDDPSQMVRETTLLALGATASDAGNAILRSVARTGSLPGERRDLGERARGFAFAGLGLARRAGHGGAELDAFVLELVREARRSERDEVAEGALVYARLAPAAETGTLAVDALEGHGSQARSRAIELVARGTDAADLRRLGDLLVHRRLSDRRAAALALGDFQGELALPVLLTAYEQEREPLTRGYVLGAIGRRGDEEARRFLLDVLDEAPRAERPWIALALGLASRGESDDALRARLVAEHEAENNSEARGAWSLALGLVGDVGSMPALLDELAVANSTRRMYAALALGLVGGDEAREALRAAIGAESDDLTRTSMLQALALQGRHEDSQLLLAELAALRSYENQGLVALSLGVHGGRSTLDGCLAALDGDEHAPPARAAALEAAGLMLAQSPGLALAELARSADPDELPEWVPVLFRFTL